MFTEQQGAIADSIRKAFGENQEVRKAAIALCFYNGKILLGLADTDDDRDGKWCFPGGGIEEGESSIEASVRELYEEAGVNGRPIHMLCFTYPSKPNVYFHVLSTDEDTINMNDEFTDMRWFDMNNLPDNLYPINKEILKILYPEIDRPKN